MDGHRTDAKVNNAQCCATLHWTDKNYNIVHNAYTGSISVQLNDTQARNSTLHALLTPEKIADAVKILYSTFVQESRAVARKPRDAAAVTFRFKVRRQHSLQV